MELVEQDRNIKYHKKNISDLKTFENLSVKQVIDIDYIASGLQTYAAACWAIGKKDIANEIMDKSEEMQKTVYREAERLAETVKDFDKVIIALTLDKKYENSAQYLRECFNAEPIMEISDEIISQFTQEDFHEFSMTGLIFYFQNPKIRDGCVPYFATGFTPNQDKVRHFGCNYHEILEKDIPKDLAEVSEHLVETLADRKSEDARDAASDAWYKKASEQSRAIIKLFAERIVQKYSD